MLGSMVLKLRTVLLLCGICTAVFVAWRMRHVSMMLPLLDADVRAAAAQAVTGLRAEGFWAIDARLRNIEQTPTEICFTWDYRYRSRAGDTSPMLHEQCVSR